MPLLLMLLTSAWAGDDVRLGLLLGGGQDRPPLAPEDPTRYDPGGVAQVPLWIRLGAGASLRVGLEGWVARGQDRVRWSTTQDGQSAGYESTTHWTMGSAALLLVGPEVAVFPASLATPFFGAGGGGGAVAGFHRFEGDTTVLLDPELYGHGGAARPDPYSLQAVPAGGVWIGLRAGRRVAFEAELGYTAAFATEAPLRNADPALDARRTAWTLDVARASVGLSFPL